jgi:hypothetical protein
MFIMGNPGDDLFPAFPVFKNSYYNNLKGAKNVERAWGCTAQGFVCRVMGARSTWYMYM